MYQRRYVLHQPYERLIAEAACNPDLLRAMLRSPIAVAVGQGWPISEAALFAGICATTLGQFARETMPLVYGHEGYRRTAALRAG